MAISPGYSQLQPKYILGTDQWVSAVAEQMVGADIDRANQLREHFPFFQVGGRTLVVPRVEIMATAGFVGKDPVSTDASFSTLVSPPEEFDLTTLVGTVDLTSYTTEVQSWSIDQLELQIELKKIAVRIAFWNQFFTPLQPRGFRGLPDLVAPDQVVESAGPLTLENLDLLTAMVTEGDAEMDRKVLVMNSATFVQFIRLVRGTGASLDYAQINDRRYAIHNGVPVLVSDFVPLTDGAPDGSTRTDVWCFTMGIEDKGVYGAVPNGVGEDGLVVEHVQGQLDADAVVHRVRWYMMIILGHQRGLARLENVTIPGDMRPLILRVPGPLTRTI